MSTEKLSDFFSEAAKNGQQIGSEYLTNEGLRKGQVLSGFFLDVKTREVLDEKTGEMKNLKTVAFFLLDPEKQTMKKVVNAGIILTEAFGGGAIPKYTAIQLEYDGVKPSTGGKKTILWKPSILPFCLADCVDLLPPILQSMLNVQEVKSMAINRAPMLEVGNEPKLIN